MSMHDVALTHLDEPLFDQAGATKGDLIAYLTAVSGLIVPVLRDRPLSVIRVRGGQPPFMQKNLPAFAPDWIRTVSIWSATSSRSVRYAVCDEVSTLIWFGNQRAVEYHPTLATLSAPGSPSHLVLDIDPPAGDAFDVAVRAAQLVRAAL